MITIEGLHSKLNFNWALNVIFELGLKSEMAVVKAHVFTLQAFSNRILAN